MAQVAAAFQAGGASVSAFDVPCAAPPARMPVYACPDFGVDQFIDPVKRRRLSRFQQMALVAARQSLPMDWQASVAPERICVALGTGLGSLN